MHLLLQTLIEVNDHKELLLKKLQKVQGNKVCNIQKDKQLFFKKIDKMFALLQWSEYRYESEILVNQSIVVFFEINLVMCITWHVMYLTISVFSNSSAISDPYFSDE